VSGGADSSALLLLAVAAGCVVEAVHVDHRLRRGSPAEAETVRELALAVGATFRGVSVDVGHGPNLEARARDARYGVLPPDVLTGHTADDQAETVLLNLLRGSASAGMAAMRPGPRRPILRLRRAETVALCTARGLVTVADPFNRDRRFLRTRVRDELLPALSAAADRDLVPVLCRQADLLRDDDDLLEALAAALDPTDARALTAAPVAIARRAVRRWLAAVDPHGYRPGAAAVQRVLDVAAGRADACELGGGGRVSRSRQRLTITDGAGPTTR
jgi:tRNA(Ile)-lysidine synthase